MTAQDTFIASIEQSKAFLAQLQAKLDAFLGVDPNAVNWGDVGDANYIQEQLRRLVDEEFVEGEL